MAYLNKAMLIGNIGKDPEIRMTATVKYQIATYSGEIQVNCSENDENEVIIAKAKRIVTQRGSLPFGYESWKVVERS